MLSAQANTNGSTGSPRCVLLIPARCQPDAELLAGLARRNVRVVVVDDLPAVMFQLAAEPTRALIIAEPDYYPRLDELVQAVRTYHSQTRLWRYQPIDADHAEPALAQLNGYRRTPPAEHRPDVVTVADVPPASDVDAADSGTADRGKSPMSDETEAPLISPEELAMLLGSPDADEPADARPE